MSAGRYPVGGRVALLTGAGAGLGAATAVRLAARGARVALLDVDAEALERVAARCPSSLVLEADVTSDAGMAAAVERAVSELGGIDVAVANAGVAAPGTVARSAPEDFRHVLDVNLAGAWQTLHAVLPHVRARRGYLLAVGSLAAIAHLPGLGAYSASKAGLEALCDSLRAEERSRGVGVGYAYLGWVQTQMLAGAAREGRMPVPAPFHRVAPVESAARALVDGIEHRRKRIAHPRWLAGVLPLRGLMQPFADAAGARRARRRAQ